ncbi:hypothetical protein N7493_008270 [Penicillium malachiteum]|uniref:Zn(2)-C6 fungal-type domain-containing protein n=1 Tax=Penicillium malachiteum TaxID=1324776 RepID=A0AAD6HGX6_9EURO|nr:hypothetical protein N7493_008270 [Penicillium malachiteum]
MSDATSRKRSRAACLSCQSRKRKCSGDQPCATCAQMGTDCHYSTAPRKRRTRPSSAYGATLPSLVEPQRVPDRLSDSVPPSGNVSGSATSPNTFNRADDSRGVNHSLEANSGAAFVRKLGLRIDPARAPRLHLFAWNIGERAVANPVVMPTDSTPILAAITMLFPHEAMNRLANTFFEKVDPCYPFLEREDIISRIAERWEQSDPRYGLEQPCDAVFYGIAAFGHLFSCREILRLEHLSILAAHKILQKSVLGSEIPSIDMITGWVLRAAYLRMTASPHAAWMASCTLMHLIEATGLHLEPPTSETSAPPRDSSTQPDQPQMPAQTNIETSNNPDTRQRLFGMARHLNTWISFDLGRSRVVLHGTTTQTIPISTSTAMGTSSNQETTRVSLFHLLPLSESLDPTTSSHQSLQDLEASLTCVLDLHYSQPSLILVQSNLALCIYRRIRALNAHALLPAHLDRVLVLAGRGLHAARSMAAATSPWHQVANVPFQVVCTLLAIDSRPALALLPEAMETLREVLGVYDTAVMREAYSTAYLLVALHHRRKEDDTRALAEVLRANAAAAQQQNQQQHQLDEGDVSKREDDTLPQVQGQSQNRDLDIQQETMPVDEEFSWLGDLVIDIPSLQNFDIDQFLMTDVPWPLPEMGI